MNKMTDEISGVPLSSGNKILLHCTFVPGIDEQVISRTRTLLATFIGDGEEWRGGHRLRAAAVVAPPVCPARGLRVNAPCAATSLHEGGRCTMAIWNILWLLKKILNICIFVTDFEIHPEMNSIRTFPFVPSKRLINQNIPTHHD